MNRKSILALHMGLLFSCGVVAQDSQWLNPSAPLEFTVSNSGEAPELHFFINNSDVTALVKKVDSETYRYNSGVRALPSGDIELKIYTKIDDDWQEVESQYFQVLTRSGFERANFSKMVSLSVEGQVDEDVKGDAFASEQDHYAAASGQMALNSDHARGDFSLESGANFSMASRQENTLRYYDKGEDAAKVDLSDYIVTLTKGDLQLRMGHVSAGTNSLLVSGLSNRGMDARYRLNKMMDVGFSVQNASSIVGWQNFIGLDNSHHQISVGSVGLELSPSDPGKQRIEITWLNGRTQSISDFDVGEITDAEENTGWGLSYQGRFFTDRLNIDSAYAQSEYVNLQDFNLSFGDDLVEIEPTTDTAWYFSTNYQLFQQNYENPNKNFGTQLSYRKERADAFYRSLAAFVSADTITESVEANGNFQHANWRASYSESEDNVDNIPNILKTGTENTAYSLNFNVANWWSDPNSDESGGEPSRFSPDINISIQQVHQLALNDPNPDDSGFNGGSHLPDQMNTTRDISLGWNIGQVSVGYTYSLSDQDNRQIGRENADFERTSHSISTNFSLWDSMSVGFAIGKANNFDVEQQMDNKNRHGNINITWQLPGNFSLDSSYSLNEDTTSLGLSESDSNSFNFGLNHQWSWKENVNGQWFIRYSQQESSSSDSVFDFNSFAFTRLVTAGMSVSF